jgi:predicted N-acetyltransferase YhbS
MRSVSSIPSPKRDLVICRPAATADAPVIAELLGQLGYPATAEDVVDRLARLEHFRDAIALVAEIDGRVVGVVTGHVFPSIHAQSLVAWLTTLVVSEDHYNVGVGRRLAEAVEEWARGHGAARISVTSGKHRDGAHAFYEHIGYERTGVRLTKILA